MVTWQAHYQDQQHDVDCVIENYYGDNSGENVFKMCIGDVVFWGDGLDDWGLSDKLEEASLRMMQKKFSFMKYGNKKKGYSYLLQSYRLQINIPTILFSLEKQCKISAELQITFVNNG